MAASSVWTRSLRAKNYQQSKHAVPSPELSKCPMHGLVYRFRGRMVTLPLKRCTSTSVPALGRSRRSEAAVKLEEEETLWEEAFEQAEQGGGGDARNTGFHQVVSPVPDAGPNPNAAPQRALFIGGFAILVGAAAIALWSSQWLRLPWQKSRAPQGLLGQQSALSDSSVPPEALEKLPIAEAEAVPSVAADGQEGLGSRPLQAARVVQQQRQDDLAVRRAAEQASLAAQLLSDPLAEVGASQQSPQEDTAASEEPLSSQLREVSTREVPATALPDLSRSAGPEEEEAVFPKASDVTFVEQVDTPADAGPSELPSAEEDSTGDAPASALPDLSRSAGPDEEAVFPKASDVNFVEQLDPPTEEGTSELPSAQSVGEAAVSSEDVVDGPGGSFAGLPGDLAPLAAAELPQSVALVIEEEKVGELALPTDGAPSVLSAPSAEQEQQLLQKPEHIRRSQQELPQVPGQLRLVSGGLCAASPEKAAAGKQGEDSYFVSSALWGALGVADGVGSWTNEGVDPALYSRRLMETAEAAMKDGWGRLPNQGARGLMHLAQAATADVQGTSTVCVALMQPGCTLQAANLGDSGFRIFRDGECIFASEVQQHSFNCPYQAGSRLLHPNSDCANSADCYEIVLAEGDMLVMATDGIFDNLWDRDLEKIVIKHTKAGVRDEQAARRLAGKIVQAALARGKDDGARTPWVVEAAKHAPDLLPWHKRMRPRGGKPDDCTAVVAFLNLDEY